MANVKNNAAAQDTQRRLLEAAGEVFAEKGFHSATIKEITDRAGASLASVNYHFRDKAELYAAVIRKIEADAMAYIPPAEMFVPDPPTRFRQIVRHIVHRMLGRGQPSWERILLAREFALLSPEMLSLIDHVAKPIHGQLSAVIGELLGRDPADECVGHHVASIIGQCVYYLQHQPHLQRLHSQFKRGCDVGHVADHIAEFSLAGILAQADAGAASTPRPRRGRTAV